MATPSNSAFYIGPSIHYGGKDFFVTATFLTQLPWGADYLNSGADSQVVNGQLLDVDFEKYRLRLKLGYYL